MSSPSSTAANTDRTVPSQLGFPVVGIGASAGGIAALKVFFEHMPAESGMAFVIVLHLSPDHQRVADGIIRAATSMPVVQVNSCVPIEPDHVYVISPAWQLIMTDGHLKVVPSSRPSGKHVAIDLFFRDLADVHKQRSFCVVLSGAGSDGAVGLSRIKEQGGITLVQSPADAEFDGMPLAAIATGLVDAILPVADIPQKLLGFWMGMRSIRVADAEAGIQANAAQAGEDSEQALQDILMTLRNCTGYDFQHYKRATVIRRIERRLQITGRADLPSYLRHLEQHPDEAKNLLEDLLIGVTNYFRDREAFEALERLVLSVVLNPGGPEDKREDVRIWSAGCSTGEEAYSLAILCAEHRKLEPALLKLQVFATDIDERAIAIGRAGIYPEAIITDVSTTRLRQYFAKENDHYRVRKEIREKVLFARHSLLCDPPFSQVDLIVCRNVLIYLDREIQKQMLQMFYFALRPGGYLFMGSSESADLCPELFKAVDKRNRIFRANVAANIPVEQNQNQVMTSLESELHRTKLHLQETIEKSEVSSEELEASNEEMQAINQELRLATEELETSKEELQSINEELLTVNFELKSKVEETDKINDYLANLIASTDIATVFVDRNMHIRWFTPRAQDIFSMRQTDTGRSLLDITHRLDYPKMTEDAAAVHQSLTVREREVSSSDRRWYIARLLPYRSSEDHIDGTVLTFIDITKRREAEQDLRLGQERMRLVAESTQDFAIIILDGNGVICEWNRGAESIFGHSAEQIAGSHFDVLFTDQDRAAGVPEAELRKAQVNGRAEDERWHLRRDGSRLYCSGETARLRGDTPGYVKIARDMTGQKHLQDEQGKRLAETRTSSLLKDEFFAFMSHELKHPLNLIQLNAEILRRLPAVQYTAKGGKALAVINDAVTSQTRIIDDLLDVARLRTGKLMLKKELLDLADMLKSIHAMAIEEYPTARILLVLPEPRGPMVVHGDARRLEQIIWNLINNALKFSGPQAWVTVELSLTEKNVRLAVSDNGPGLSADDVTDIFELFRQPHHTRHHGDGLGIGLSLVKQLVQAHGGTVSAHSAGLGLGSTFSVQLPLSQRTLGKGAANPDAGPSEGRLKGVHVLLVDDSADVVDVMRMLLEMEDAHVTTFLNPVEALENVGGHRFDVILTDIGMPEMDGHAFITAIREQAQYQATPAIALSGYGVSPPSREGRVAHFDLQLTRPVHYDELVGAIESLCRASQTL
ncbi:CheR family methyltransferase [Pseudomonas sp. URMO17WK12:I11]|uniref:CheR family methyltransferase n=1 Tax=Pseudomonas sp. URMO17WK12:I11 TaxID=1283291 RepID=UPI0011AAC06D|nr:CheR family methyltransferase [Pseudomonas sp. URMO17WK12:I11]